LNNFLRSGPTLEKVEISCVGVWLVVGNEPLSRYGCTKNVRYCKGRPEVIGTRPE
jgi:hypothetical protein